MPRRPTIRSGMPANAASDLRRRFGNELRIARMAAGLTQRRLANAAGVSQTLVSQVERARRRPNWDVAAALAAATGHDLSLKLYPVRTASLRDSGQLALAEDVVRELHARWTAQLEAPIPGSSLRAADVLLRGGHEMVQIEIERRLVDFQAQLRAAQLKRRDLADHHDVPVRLVIAIPDTRLARSILSQHEAVVRRALPIGSRRGWQALREGGTLGGDGVLLVRGSPRRSAG